MDQSVRPTFYYKQNKCKPIRAGGVIFYKRVDEDIFFLMIKNNGMYEDIGGKTDVCDTTIEDTVRREVAEESNGLITSFSIFAKNGFYNEPSKYLVYTIEADNDIKERCCSEYGDKEIHNGLKRTFCWINKDNIDSKDIHIRIRRFIKKFKIK